MYQTLILTFLEGVWNETLTTDQKYVDLKSHTTW